MLNRHFGVGGELSLRPSRGDYGPLQYRQTFYDFNGIFSPASAKHFRLRLEGGIGGAKTGFTLTQSSCIGTAVCSNLTQSAGSSSHFQVHGGLGVDLFLTGHLFLRPQFDIRYVPNLTNQFGSNTVTGGMLWIGFGHRG